MITVFSFANLFVSPIKKLQRCNLAFYVKLKIKNAHTMSEYFKMKYPSSK